MSHPLKLLLLAIATLLMGALAISYQSFWIDEGSAAVKAIQPTLADWWRALREESHSNLQLLPHLYYLWAWEKVFGASEVSLRAANLPLLFGGLAAALWALQKRPLLQFCFPMLVLVNAYCWYYTGEARPYILLFSSSCLALGCLARAFDDPEGSVRDARWFWLFCLGLFLVAATSLVAVPWAVAWGLSAIPLLGAERLFRLIRTRYWTSIIFGVATLALAAYYAWTMSLGARASTVVGGTGILNLGVVFYEQLGLAGLGPGRNELRAHGIYALQPFVLPLSGGAFVLLATAWFARTPLRAFLRDKRLGTLILMAVVVPFAAVMFAGWLMEVRIIGRHLTPLFPWVTFAMAVAAAHLGTTKKRVSILVLLLLLTMLLVSALQVRFARRHTRDDYRGAAAYAVGALRADKTVWWAADQQTGQFYGVELSREGDARGKCLIQPTAAELAAAPTPDLIVISKRDLYDAHGAVEAFATEHGFRLVSRLQAFTVFELPPR